MPVGRHDPCHWPPVVGHDVALALSYLTQDMRESAVGIGCRNGFVHDCTLIVVIFTIIVIDIIFSKPLVKVGVSYQGLRSHKSDSNLMRHRGQCVITARACRLAPKPGLES